MTIHSFAYKNAQHPRKQISTRTHVSIQTCTGSFNSVFFLNTNTVSGIVNK